MFERECVSVGVGMCVGMCVCVRGEYTMKVGCVSGGYDCV